MVAVLVVFANHLWDWPSGGFIGVDVFFVISGFLITSNLLRTAETKGNVSFREFYWNRVRRIVPAATTVLLLTVAAAYLVFLPFRAQQVGIDAGWAFIFLSNWWFAYQGTDYFRAAAESVSPLQHYWSLSIEEQFYFVWPALIFFVGVIAFRRKWNHQLRMRTAGGVMAGIVAVSLGWALYQTATDPIAAYFNTFSRVWELGVGALLATAVGALTQIPAAVKPLMSWAGLGVIAASIFLIADNSVGFPAPWALAPVIGAALVIAAGVGEEPNYQPFLRNPVSGYIGDISYSLYLVHWPVIVIVGALMESGPSYWATVLGLGFGLAVASYHLVENPLRRSDWGTIRVTVHEIRKGRYQTQPSSRYAAFASLVLIAVAVLAFALRPGQYEQITPPPVAVSAPQNLEPSGKTPQLGPLTEALQGELRAALNDREWPPLDPSMESVIAGEMLPPGVKECVNAEAEVNYQACTWGSDAAPIKMVIVGDSIAANYTEPLRDIALNSNDQIQLSSQSLPSCPFIDDLVIRDPIAPNCADRKQNVVDYINTTKPQVVVIANWYGGGQFQNNDRITPKSWSDSLRRIVERFRGNTQQVVFLAPPAGAADIQECFSRRSSSPAKCIGRVEPEWFRLASAEQDLAQQVGAVWVDSRLWFCSENLCPSFAGTTPTKHDTSHMAFAYGRKITPAIGEALREARVLP